MRTDVLPRSDYNRLAGRSLARVAALSDGIFAVAMTLLVLDLRVPELDAAHAHHPLSNGGAGIEGAAWSALVSLAPRLLTYMLSFLTLGIFWLAQQAQLEALAESDRNLAWLHLGFLVGVALMPFSTSLLADFITARVAVVTYEVNLLILGLALFAAWKYAGRAELLRDEIRPRIRAANERRIALYQALYAMSALLSLIHTYISITFLVLLQLNSLFAPGLALRPIRRGRRGQ